MDGQKYGKAWEMGTFGVYFGGGACPDGSDGSVMLSENEMHRLKQLSESAWLYIVVNCKSAPALFRFQNPGKNLTFEQKTKGIQYFLPMNSWKSTIKG